MYTLKMVRCFNRQNSEERATRYLGFRQLLALSYLCWPLHWRCNVTEQTTTRISSNLDSVRILVLGKEWGNGFL